MEELQFSQTGKKWTAEEDQQLIDEYNTGNDIVEISSIHKRLPNGIASRLVLLNVIDDKMNARGYTNYKYSDYYQNYLNSEKRKEYQEKILLNETKKIEKETKKIENETKKMEKENETKKESQIQKLEFQIQKLEFKNQKLEFQIQKTPNNDFEINITNDIFNIKNELKEIKSSITELKDMLNSIYEFEFVEV
jgi:hypothetical protein